MVWNQYYDSYDVAKYDFLMLSNTNALNEEVWDSYLPNSDGPWIKRDPEICDNKIEGVDWMSPSMAASGLNTNGEIVSLRLITHEIELSSESITKKKDIDSIFF